MLHKNILAISIVTASLLIGCGGGSSSTSDTNTTHESAADNPTIISNLKVTPLVTATRSVKASSDFTISYTIEDKDGLVDSAIHVKGKDGIEIKTKTFTFQATQTKENVSATFNINEIGKYSVEVEAKGVGSSSNSSKKSDATFEVTPKDEVAPKPTPTPIDNLTNKKGPSVSNITKTTATISSKISDADGVKDIKYYLNGVEVSSPNLTGLTAGTTYEVYTSAMVKNGITGDDEKVESEKVSFTTQSETTPTNTAPETTNDTANTAHNTPVTIDVLANDTDTDNDILTITNANGTNGTWVIEANKIKFTPTNGFSGTATATYEVSDGKGGTDTASVSVEVETPAPTWSTIADITEWDGTGKNFTRDFSTYVANANGGTFSATNLPTGLTIDENTGVVTGYFDADSSEANRDGNSNVFSNIIITYTKNGKTYNSNAFTWDIENEG